jgi:hypothetical protein
VKKKKAIVASTALAVGGALITGPLAGPASAACVTNVAYTNTDAPSSQTFRTSTGNSCTTVEGWKTWTAADYVRGQYYSPSEGWTNSGQGWKFVTTTLDQSGPAIIVNILDDVLVRGRMQTYTQNVTYGR